MDTRKIAEILFYMSLDMSLDMDYDDALDYTEEEIDCIAKELEVLKENNCDSTIQALEMITMENESIVERFKNI